MAKSNLRRLVFSNFEPRISIDPFFLDDVFAVDDDLIVEVGDLQNERVLLDGGMIRIGQNCYRVEQVREYALAGENIQLERGAIQAAIMMLVVADAERGQRLRDSLMARISEYEVWVHLNK